jgi:DNA-binding response OmpR family regulator
MVALEGGTHPTPIEGWSVLKPNSSDGGQAGLVLVSRDWQTRALLRAQLLEEGCSVHAYESLQDAAAELKAGALQPRMLIAELSGRDWRSELEQLSELAARLPVWVLASHSDVDETILKWRGFETVLFRPVDMGDLVRRAKRRLEKLTH